MGNQNNKKNQKKKGKSAKKGKTLHNKAMQPTPRVNKKTPKKNGAKKPKKKGTPTIKPGDIRITIVNKRASVKNQAPRTLRAQQKRKAAAQKLRQNARRQQL